MKCCEIIDTYECVCSKCFSCHDSCYFHLYNFCRVQCIFAKNIVNGHDLDTDLWWIFKRLFNLLLYLVFSCDFRKTRKNIFAWIFSLIVIDTHLHSVLYSKIYQRLQIILCSTMRLFISAQIIQLAIAIKVLIESSCLVLKPT